MFDFLKAFPSISMDKYMWGMSLAQIALAKYDTTRIIYLPDEGDSPKKEIKIDNPMDLLNDLNIPIIKA